MTPFQISALITSLSSFVFSFFVFFNNKKEKVSIFWFLSSFFIGLWSLGLLGVVLSENYSSAWVWQNILDISGILVPVFYINFIIYLLKSELKYKKIKIISWILGFLLLILSFSNLFKSGLISQAGFHFWIQPGAFYFLFPLLFAFLVTYSFILLFKEYKLTKDETLKMQIKYITFAQIFGFGGGVTNFFPQLFNVYPFGNYLVILYVFFISYAVFKHQLFNIKTIAAELLTFAIWIFLLVRVLLDTSLKDKLIDGSLLILVVFFGILLIRSVLKEVKTREEMEALAWKLEQANIKLKELDKAKSDFVTITSHQLRTPITAIKGYASMVLEGSFGAVPEKAKVAIDRIFQSSNRLVLLINDFLNLSRIERGKMEYVFAKVNLKEMLEVVFDEFKTINAKKKMPLELSLNIADKEDFSTSADSDKIRQTIYNLIDNAVKYTQNGFVKISLYKDAGKNEIIMKVEDSGKGMSKETLDNIFEKFARAKDESKKYQVEGTGLGLYVAREIAKAHGGDVWAESAGLDKGSAFYMKLPVKNV